MKLKNKILISGISTLSVLGATAFTVNNINYSSMQNNGMNIAKQKRNVDQATWTELTTIEEVEAHLPNISTTGAPFQMYNDYYASSSANIHGSQPNFFTHPSYADSMGMAYGSRGNKFFLKELPSGALTLKYENGDPNSTSGYFGIHGGGLMMNQAEVNAPEVKFFYDGVEYISIAVTFNNNPNWYDVGTDGKFTGTYPSLPTDAELDSWHFKIKTGVKSTITNIVPTKDSVEFDLLEPMWPLTELQPDSFDISVNGSPFLDNVAIENPGQKRTIKLDIDGSIYQGIIISFNNNDSTNNYLHKNISAYSLPPVATSRLSVDQYSHSHMKLKIDEFKNGLGYTEADRFEISINDIVEDHDKHLISELDTGTFTKDLDIARYPSGTDLNIEILYYRDNVLLVLEEDKVTITVPPPTIDGSFALQNIFDLADPQTYGKIKVHLFGETLLPNSTQVKITATRIDDPTEIPTVKIVPIPDEVPGENTKVVELSLSHPATYKVDVEYIDLEDQITANPSALLTDEIVIPTGPTETELKDGTALLSNVSENALSLSGKFDIGIDENGNDLTGETFELLLNDVSLDSNLLSEDNSNLDPLNPPALGTFDKTYSNLALDHFGVIPGVKTNLAIELNGVQVWTEELTFTAKPFEITNIEAKNIDYTTATIEWAMTQGEGIEKATKYTIQVFDNGPSFVAPIYEETVDFPTIPPLSHDVSGLSSGRDYTVRMQFMNSDDVPLLDTQAEISFQAKQDYFEMTDLSIQDKTQDSVKIVFDGFKQGTGDEIATQYTLKVTEATGLTPPIDLLITDLTNEYYELTNLAPGGTYTVEIQFKNSEDTDLLGTFTKVIDMAITQFEVENLVPYEVEYETAKILFDGFVQGTGTQEASKYDLELYKDGDVSPILEEEGTIGADLFHNLEALESGVTYSVKITFKNDSDAPLLTKETTSFTTKQDNFELEGGITATATGDLSASVSFGVLKQGTGNQKATSYEVSWFNEGTEVGSATEQILDGDTKIDPYSITTGLVEGGSYTVKVQFKSGTTDLIEYSDDFTLTQLGFEFTGIDTTNIGENSADVLLQGIQQGTGTQEATVGVITITGAKTLPTEGEPIVETWELPIDMSNGIPDSQSLDGLILASEYTVSVEFKNSSGDTLGVSHTKTFNTTTRYTAIDTSISNFNTVFDSKTNTINFTWNFVKGIDKYGREDAIPDIKMTLNFPDQQVKKEYIFSELASTGSFTIDLNKMIEEKQITQTDIDNGFTVESESGIIKFENSKFTWTQDNTFWTIMVISLLTAGAYLLVKLISKKRKIIL